MEEAQRRSQRAWVEKVRLVLATLVLDEGAGAQFELLDLGLVGRAEERVTLERDLLRAEVEGLAVCC